MPPSLHVAHAPSLGCPPGRRAYMEVEMLNAPSNGGSSVQGPWRRAHAVRVGVVPVLGAQPEVACLVDTWDRETVSYGDNAVVALCVDYSHAEGARVYACGGYVWKRVLADLRVPEVCLRPSPAARRVREEGRCAVAWVLGAAGRGNGAVSVC